MIFHYVIVLYGVCLDESITQLQAIYENHLMCMMKCRALAAKITRERRKTSNLLVPTRFKQLSSNELNGDEYMAWQEQRRTLVDEDQSRWIDYENRISIHRLPYQPITKKFLESGQGNGDPI